MCCSEHPESIHGGAEVGALSRAKHVLSYLRGIMEYVQRYIRDGQVKLQGYLDTDWDSSATNMKISLGIFFSLRSVMISWFRRK